MSILNHPLTKRKLFCVGISLITFALIAKTIPAETAEAVPMFYAATLIHGLILGWAITVIGVFDWNPIFDIRMHSLLRGGVVGVFIHLDYTIYTWTQPEIFWKTIVFALVFGAVLDFIATILFGEGKKLLEGWVK